MIFSYLFTMEGIKLRHHVLFWSGLIIVTVAVLSPYYLNLFKATMHRLVFLPVWLLATYVNLYFLLPRFWDRGKKWRYVSLLFSLVFMLTVLQRVVCIELIYPALFWMRPPTAEELNPFWLGPFIQFFIFIMLPIGLSMGIREGWKWFRESMLSKESELKYLKAQVNPHFLFNTLNNLYGLSLESSQKVPGMILKLSELLSYSLYESQVESVPISKEIGLIRDFIALESERYGDRVRMDFKVEQGLDMEMRIAPLLMLPLVENAFKHGVRNATEAIDVKIHVSYFKGAFTFIVENEISLSDSGVRGGLGLENLRKRLSLLYPGKHQLNTKESDGKFYVELIIQDL